MYCVFLCVVVSSCVLSWVTELEFLLTRKLDKCSNEDKSSLWINNRLSMADGMFVLTTMEMSLCLLSSVDDNILSNCLNLRYCSSEFVRWVSCIKHISAFNFVK